MASQNRPSSKKDAPDPATNYERAKPEKEAGMGRLDAPKPAADENADRSQDAVHNKQVPRQINAHDVDKNA